MWMICRQRKTQFSRCVGLYFIVGKIIKVKIPKTMYYSKICCIAEFFGGNGPQRSLSNTCILDVL